MTVLHYPNGRGGTLCLAKNLKVSFADSAEKVTCKRCRHRLDFKRRTPGQIARAARRGGLRSASLPSVQQKFGGKLLASGIGAQREVAVPTPNTSATRVAVGVFIVRG